MPNLNVEFDQFNSKQVGSSKLYTLYFLKKKYIQEKKQPLSIETHSISCVNPKTVRNQLIINDLKNSYKKSYYPSSVGIKKFLSY
ncbi:hypothetical protein Cycma_0899 [Cyclobacterium marinum DSM 745]|uniref:Uncharacterized protein n=1 Tax=Cyclobacterium marinum (strain ATCC 25205 / DSM 745 / LMG 13164 / NCIMB 1802) TaxID=880070 RepID=G0J4K6_CYCMS|nr:hypothetical protein Cycma_0899 [Cyclobacterium marinum DSM 745]